MTKAKAEKGLEPVAEVTGYKQITPALVIGTKLYAHPPTQVEPVAWRDALTDCASALRYIKQTHGELYGVGFDRALDKADAALAHPPTSEWNEDEFAELIGKIEDWGNSHINTPSDELTRRYEVMWEAIRGLKR